MNRIPIALFRKRPEAEPIRQRLVNAGIPAEIHEENLLQRLWFITREAAGVRLEVPAPQFEQAEALLLAWDAAEGFLAQAIRCPDCKSLLVEYPQFARNSVLTNMAVGMAAEFGLVERDYYCEQCHYTWPKAPAQPPRERQHMAPYYFLEDVGGAPAHAPAHPPTRTDPPRKAA